MTLEALVTTYGYAAIFVGTVLEGETILVLGGVAAKVGYLKLGWVIVSAFLGSMAGDQFYFYIGRRYGSALLGRYASWHVHAGRAERLLDRYGTVLIVSFRFLYGLRSITPFVIGMSRVSARRFALLNAFGAAVWACALGTGGYLFGHVLEVVLGNIKRYELEVLGSLAAVGTLIWLVHVVRVRRSASRRRADRE